MEQLIEALQIMIKYGNPKNPFHCEHDYLYVDINWESISDEDQKKLKELGFFEDENYGEGGIGSFKYGRC